MYNSLLLNNYYIHSFYILRTVNTSPANQASANSSNPSKSENVPTMNGGICIFISNIIEHSFFSCLPSNENYVMHSNFISKYLLHVRDAIFQQFIRVNFSSYLWIGDFCRILFISYVLFFFYLPTVKKYLLTLFLLM